MMTTTAPALEYPAVGIVEGGLTHAAAPGVVPQHGWGRAMCNSRLYVSIDHRSGYDAEGRWTSQIPLRATGQSLPTIDPDEGVVGEGVDCIKCARAVARWEGEQAAEELAGRMLLRIAEDAALSVPEIAAALDVPADRVDAVLHTRLLRRRLAQRAPYVIDDHPTYRLTPAGAALAHASKES